MYEEQQSQDCSYFSSPSKVSDEQATKSFQLSLQLQSSISSKITKDKSISKKPQKTSSRPFSQLEDELILHLIDRFGPKFKKFTKFFTARQANILKNRYYKVLRFQVEEEQSKKHQQDDKMPTNHSKEQNCNVKENLFQLLSQSELSSDMTSIMSNCLNGIFSTFQQILN